MAQAVDAQRERSRAAVRSAALPIMDSGGGHLLDTSETGIKYLAAIGNTANYSAQSLTAGR